MKYLIIGHKGQLGKEFCTSLKNTGHNIIGYDIDEIDVADRSKVFELVEDTKPTIIVNCSAYNLVDKAETDYFTAFKTNSLGVKNLAEAAKQFRANFVHYSTDYVFDGTKNKPYTEDDAPNPLNMYGKSKLLGELFLKEELDNHLLFRLSWVFGNGTQNFIYKFQEWAKNKKQLQISNDEISVPTWTKTIVELTVDALNKELHGTYHLTNTGHCSRYDWAKLIKETLNLDVEIESVPRSTFILPAVRPANSAMSNKKLIKDLGVEILNWKDAVKQHLAKE